MLKYTCYLFYTVLAHPETAHFGSLYLIPRTARPGAYHDAHNG